MKTVWMTILEGAILIALAFVVGLSANAVNDKGVRLTRDYFKKSITTRPAREGNTQTQSAPATQQDPGTEDDKAPHLNANGLWTIGTDLANEWYNDPKTGAMEYVWVDARKPEEYEKEHIPGAHLLYHFQVDHYLPAVMPMLQAAEKIVVYCGGGECEDSILLARHLIEEAGLPYEKVFVYVGGVEEWKARKFLLKSGGDQP